ncbi:MAG: PD40 domain-containing protein, partial [Paludibacteraceae bacterium]|nr:PD40 domain-containing protein [Paludibacteraceae bacterium]
MKYRIFAMASLAILLASCSNKSDTTTTVSRDESGSTATEQAPITKPQITIRGGRLTPEGLWAMGRIGSVVSDIETGWVAYTVSYYSVEENRSTSWIRICDGVSMTGEGLQVIDEFVGSDPAWFGNSGTLAYIRGGQMYLRFGGKDVAVEGAANIEGFLLSPKRDKVILIRPVKAHPTTADMYPDLPLATGRVVTDLMYKHWDEWVDEVPQPFVCDLNVTYFEEGLTPLSASIGKSFNLLEGTPYECPMRPFGGIEQLAWNPNNKEVAYTCRRKTGLEYALSTNSDIYLCNIETGRQKNITADNRGYDTNPAYSPNGEWIAWQSMERDGYESDLNRLMALNLKTGEQRWLTKNIDDPVEQFVWYDDTTLLYTACWSGTINMYYLSLNDGIERMTEGQYDLVLGDVCDNYVYLLGHSMRQANEIYRMDVEEWKHNPSRDYGPRGIDWDQPHTALEVEMEKLTRENDNIYNQIERSKVVPRWQRTSDGKDMLTWIIYPPHFNPKKKYPTILYCEGGPQSPVSQFWSFRWNFMMMSAGDYIIVAPNRRGLPGF